MKHLFCHRFSLLKCAMGPVCFLACLLTMALSFPVAAADKPKPLQGRVIIDGSSTVYPVTEAVAEEYHAIQPKVKVTIGVSGTGGGFKKFFNKETDINNASRKIKDSEIKKAAAGGLEWIEIPVAYDGISVVVHKKNDWLNTLSSAQLKRLWEPSSQVKKWSDLDPSLPERKIKLYGPGADSGTFDFFTEKVSGKARASRSDYTASEDDSVLVKGVAGDVDALGYFGYAYYLENASRLKVLAIESGGEAHKPTLKTIASGQYYLSRPIYIYVSKASALANKAVASFVEFYLSQVKHLVGSVGYVAMSDSAYDRAKTKFQQQSTKVTAKEAKEDEKVPPSVAKDSTKNSANK